ncbi:MAG: nucleotidyltransferase family protein [Acidobacteriota bacterium]
MAGAKSGCWPDKQQQLLLRAALCPGDTARNAWTQWSSGVDIDLLDLGSYRLLPLVYRNLKSIGIADAELVKLKRAYRQTWYQNQTLFHRFASVLRLFRENGIETMVLKGTALTLLYYKDTGLRPMADIDLLVQLSERAAAINLLVGQGWSPVRPIDQRAYVFMHADAFRDSAGRNLDLHWHLLPECHVPSDDSSFWAYSATTTVLGEPTRVLSPTDQLLHVCVHGAGWDPVPPVRWVADAMTILRASDEIDWVRLGSKARSLQLTLALRDTLEYLSSALSAEIPTTALESLRTTEVSRAERLDYVGKTSPPETLSPALYLWIFYRKFQRAAGGAGLGLRMLAFTRFLQHRWAAPHWWLLPFRAVRHGARIIRRRISPLGAGAK